MSLRKGVVLAGGTGTRLRPYTFAINKHLLPVFDRPMVAYPIQTLRDLGVREICVVTGREHVADFRAVLGSGESYGVSLTFRGQEAPQGVAHALLQSEEFFQGQKVIAVLGDDVFDEVQLDAAAFTDDNAYAFVTKATDQANLAIAEVDPSGRILRVGQRSPQSRSEWMVVGLYVFPCDVFDVIRGVRPSPRGELEVSSVTDWYLQQGRLKSVMTNAFIADAGTEEGFKLATLFSARKAGYRGD
jgi:glucose-1-phosphate thymidylyltransferase